MMLTVYANPQDITIIGRLGENLHRRIQFDISEFSKMYPNASYRLLHQRPGDSAAYPVADVTVDGNSVYWTVSNADLSADGKGRCELIVMDGDIIAKSIIYLTRILTALDGSGTAPDPWESWLNRFQEYAQEASGAAASALESAQSASGSAQTATDKAGAASESANAAAGSATTAFNKAGEASVSAQSASESATTATNKAGEASASATAASGSALAADASASGAAANALKSEGFAVGEQNGLDVRSESPYYHNNAKYYSEQSAESAAAAAQHNMGVSVSGTTLVFANVI